MNEGFLHLQMMMFDEINTIMLSMLPRNVKSYMSYDALSNSNNYGPFRRHGTPWIVAFPKDF